MGGVILVTNDKQITIAVSVALQDAGESTRSLEIVKGIRDYAPNGYSIKVVFLSHGGKFEQNVLDSGFQIYKSTPRLDGVGFHNDFKPSANNFVGNPALTIELLEGEIKSLKECRPDIILYGFWPFASLARRMLSPQIPGVCFLPIPLEPTVYCSSLMKDVPDQIKPLTFLPVRLRRAIMKALPMALKLKAPILRQQNIINAARHCGWDGQELRNLFDLMKSDITVVNDLALFYKGISIPSNFKITGPLYSPADNNDELDPNILRIFGNKNDCKTKLFCSMGSSGKKSSLIEAIKAIVSLPEELFGAVILVPNAVCPIEEAIVYAKGKKNIYMTDRFIPATLVNKFADIVISHGGQGTVQTAMSCATPIVGVAMQPEQQINLDNIVLNGACIRIPIAQWKDKKIRKAITKIAADKKYKLNAEKLAKSMSQANGKSQAAYEIWRFIKDTVINQ